MGVLGFRQRPPARRSHDTLELACESLEARKLLTASALFEITDVGESPLPAFDADRYADYVRTFGVDEPLGPAGPIFEAFLRDPYSAADPDSGGGDSRVWESYDLSQTFTLNSLAGADHTIYLDFDGHTTTDTLWNANFNSDEPIHTPAYNFLGDNETFADSELARIQRIWARVAEDFAPFNVNVTTQDPGVEALRRAGSGDTQWGARVVIGDDTFYGNAGGVAYIGSFVWTSDTPSFVFNTSERGVSEAASHEAGHALGLFHDGRTGEEYYGGHGSGATSWAPIMGVSYYQSVSQWSQGEYADATRQEDDLTIIATSNGFGYRADDYGDSYADARALLQAGEVEFDTTFGIIEQNTDDDFFSFLAGAGAATIDVTPLSFGANLDILANLYDSTGTVISSSNPTDLLHASISLDLPTAGQYFLSVTGTGVGDPQTGYSDYGSLGNYRISGAVTEYLGEPNIEIRAAGTTGSEQMLLQIDGVTVAAYNNVGGDTAAGVFETFAYAAAGVTPDQIRIVFANDGIAAGSGINRDLRVDSITIDDVVYQTEHPSVFSTGTVGAYGLEPGYHQSEYLHTNGHFAFADPDLITALAIRASGDMGTEQFDVLVDGVRVRTFTAGIEYGTYAFQTGGNISADQIRVVFRGDTFDPDNQVDTNLHVDWLEVEGARFQTESINVFSTAVRSDSGDIQAGFGLGETLSTQGYFQYSAGTNPASVQVDALEGVRVTRRAISVVLGSEDGPLIVDLSRGTVGKIDGYIQIPDTVRRVLVTGTAGEDQIHVVGTADRDASLLRRDFLRLRGGNTTVIGHKLERVHLYGSGGDDRSTVRGGREPTELSDVNPEIALLTGDGFAFSIYETETVRLRAYGRPDVPTDAPQSSPTEVRPVERAVYLNAVFVATSGLDPAFTLQTFGNLFSVDEDAET